MNARFIALIALVGACAAQSDGSSGSTAGGSTHGASEHQTDGTQPSSDGGASESSGAAEDPDTACAAFVNRDGCVHDGSDFTCSWQSFVVYERDQDACALQSTVERCVAMPLGGPPGCVAPEACAAVGEVRHRTIEGQMLLWTGCGGPSPIGWELCDGNGTADAAIPPECACLCELAS
jgi:hypothetical protein